MTWKPYVKDARRGRKISLATPREVNSASSQSAAAQGSQRRTWFARTSGPGDWPEWNPCARSNRQGQAGEGQDNDRSQRDVLAGRLSGLACQRAACSQEQQQTFRPPGIAQERMRQAHPSHTSANCASNSPDKSRQANRPRFNAPESGVAAPK